MRHIVTHAGMNRLPFLGHEKWEKNHWTVRVVRNCARRQFSTRRNCYSLHQVKPQYVACEYSGPPPRAVPQRSEDCLSTEVAPGARRRTSLTFIPPSSRPAELAVKRISIKPISAAREQTPPHAPERTGQLNSRHSHESQPEQSSLIRRVPESAVVVMMTAAAIVFLVIVAVVVAIVSTLAIYFFGSRPIEAVLGAFGFLAVDQR